jgi:4'-phosphopantetheinyl transferase
MKKVDVWIVPLDGAATSAERLVRCLSPEERTRCERVSDDRRRQRAVLARAALRHILAATLGADAAALEIRRSERGKPVLANAPDTHFSLSHSGDLALVAVAPASIGVDVEHERTVHQLLRVARRILHPLTVARLQTLEERAQHDTFLDAWTLREAHVKAVGGGLFHTPDALPFDPTVPADGTPVALRDRTGDGVWTLARLRPAPGARAAIVAEGVFDTLHVHDVARTRRFLEEIP